VYDIIGQLGRERAFCLFDNAMERYGDMTFKVGIVLYVIKRHKVLSSHIRLAIFLFAP